ncbi:ABC transporter ATP-binding protein [Chitinophaga qingshengii]|uniref:ATP-binding cassette domain-containing protein n=1 Tax=Chitinophaga qingshengii TaxID=1569794 RepID=A0ABR7TGR2_9BACT|nr:ABC transporter transmembrane domain-containing protein [Chitinophaga qingshengii]MBC9929145.1 ATP-binding cassette domain-containing protein [Chitinophaga qingshengii]
MTAINHHKKDISRSLQLFKYLQPYWATIAAGLLCLVISSLAGLAFPEMLGRLIDASKQDNMRAIHITGLVLIGLLTVQSAASFFRTVLFVKAAEKALASLRQTIYNHLIQLPMHFFLTRRVGELNSRISSDVMLLQETFTTTLAEFIRQLLTIVGGLVFLMLTSINLTIFMLAILPVMVIVAVVFGRSIRHFSQKVQDQVASSSTVVEETLQGIFSVKAFANEFREMKRYRERTDEAANIGIQNGKYRAALSSFIIMGIFGALVAVIWRGAVIGLDTGKLFSFVLYSVFIGSSIGSLTEIYASLQKSIGATENLFAILDEPAEPLSPVTAIAPEDALHGNIRFSNVSFSYPGRESLPVLRKISFQVRANQTIALVGPSGAGKSTIVSLLLRLYDTTGGHISFDNKDIHQFPLSALRSQMATVPQDVFLFGGTILENIAYGREDATEEEIIEAAQKANAWEFIERLPLGLNTIVGERGMQLSGGQRQRIAIARAVLKQPRILILDEATSALDAESEKLVQDALNKLMEGRTSIVIAHRLATIRQADKIIVIDKGSIVEEGTHHELVNIDEGLYRNLCEMQFTQ